MPETATTLKACVNCYTALCNGYDEHEWGYTPESEPLSGIPDETTITPGKICDEECDHDDDDLPEGHDEAGFSWTDCDTCESTLGGDRYYVTTWDE